MSYLRPTGSENIIVILLKCVTLEPWSFTLSLSLQLHVVAVDTPFFFAFLTPLTFWSLPHQSSKWVQLLKVWHRQIPALINSPTGLGSSFWILRTLPDLTTWFAGEPFLKVWPQLQSWRIFEILALNHGCYIFCFWLSPPRCSGFALPLLGTRYSATTCSKQPFICYETQKTLKILPVTVWRALCVLRLHHRLCAGWELSSNQPSRVESQNCLYLLTSQMKAGGYIHCGGITLVAHPATLSLRLLEQGRAENKIMKLMGWNKDRDITYQLPSWAK